MHRPEIDLTVADETTSPSRSAVPAILETDARRDVLARLVDGLGAREPFVVVTGEAGTGKTTVVRDAAAAWGASARVAFVANAAMSRSELVEQLARRFGAEPAADATKPQLLELFERSIAAICEQGQVPVIVVDDAHDLDVELLGELRLLVNAAIDAGRRLEVILIGSPGRRVRSNASSGSCAWCTVSGSSACVKNARYQGSP